MSYIFESPDGGETIYRRAVGEDVSKRTLVRKPEPSEDELWRKIRRAAKHNKVLDDLLSKAKLVYHLNK